MNWQDQTILITGGTGSFGRAFVRTMLREFGPKKLIVYSRDELKQHEMCQEPEFRDECLRFFIGDVRDKQRLNRAMAGVDILVHAAAMKQVPACEYNPIEAVKTNIEGAIHIIDVAIDHQVKKVIAISTDKAVNPVNLYGATKLVAEKLFIQGNTYAGAAPGARFSCARYGNVVGSRGSVVPLFQQQRTTGRITITDLQMTRFWITLDQAAHFVVRCLEQMEGGEVFIPKIPSMRVADLAQAIAPGCTMDVIGIRPGEKLHEVLISSDESRHTVEREDMYIVEPLFPWWTDRAFGVGSKPMEPGAKFASDTNKRWLSVEDLRRMTGEPA
jgi:UDP-N-acetylglucosamine 4,6-dehydratase